MKLITSLASVRLKKNLAKQGQKNRKYKYKYCSERERVPLIIDLNLYLVVTDSSSLIVIV